MINTEMVIAVATALEARHFSSAPPVLAVAATIGANDGPQESEMTFLALI